MKLLTMEMISDAQGNLNLPSMSLKGLESDASFTMQVCTEEEEYEDNTLSIPKILLDDADIDPEEGLQVMTKEGMVIVCAGNQQAIAGIHTGGR